MIIVICNCFQFNVIKMNQSEIRKALDDEGGHGWVVTDHPKFEYKRNTDCAMCDKTVYFKEIPSKDRIYRLGLRNIADSLQKAVKDEVDDNEQ